MAQRPQILQPAQVNQAIAQLLEDLNNKPFQKLPGSRKSAFESMDRPALKPLPVQSYQFAEWKKATVNVDYHIEVDRHYYSVPHTLLKKNRCAHHPENQRMLLQKQTRSQSHP